MTEPDDADRERAALIPKRLGRGHDPHLTRAIAQAIADATTQERQQWVRACGDLANALDVPDHYACADALRDLIRETTT